MVQRRALWQSQHKLRLGDWRLGEWLSRGCEARLQERMMTLDEFFEGQAGSRRLFDALWAMVSALGSAELRVTKSQIAFRRRTASAWAWMPGKYLRGKTSPLVLTLGFRHRDPSPRWKQIVEPSAGRFTHDLELWSLDDIDRQVDDWLRAAWKAADQPVVQRLCRIAPERAM